ncbi:MAG: DUF4760 domain-containing protein [Chitinispirillia bacterium]|nr:DUF4760 domain-containing protein [Chitinispirillia bacterium]
MCEFVKEYLDIAEPVAVIVGVIFLAFQIWRQAEIARANHDRKKKQSTIEFYIHIYAECEKYLRCIGQEPLDMEKVNCNKELNDSVIGYLARLEIFAIGVNSGVYDFNILSRMVGLHLSKKYDILKQYIENLRVAENNKWCYYEFETLTKKLKASPAGAVDDNYAVKQP